MNHRKFHGTGGMLGFKTNFCQIITIFFVAAHMYSMHEVTVDSAMQILKCPHCPFTSAVRSRYDDHMRVHADLRDIPCPHCPKLFITQKALRGHIIKVTIALAVFLYWLPGLP